MTTTTTIRKFDITKGDLHFAMAGNGFVCKELQTLGGRFLERWTPEEIQRGIDRYVTVLRDNHEKCYPNEEEYKKDSPEKRKQLGQETFDQVVGEVKHDVEELKFDLFEQFLSWLGDWWYYHPKMRMECRRTNTGPIMEAREQLVAEYLVPVLPDQVCESLKDAEPSSVAVGYGHFALLFCDKQKKGRRYIVTDASLYQYDGVSGYLYLDILPDGRPVARSRCDRGGERAFFDGVRFMSHNMFQTCAPKTIVFHGGYKVNSTRCTIINGYLYPLVDVDDPVAYTTGQDSCPIFNHATFSRKEAVDSLEVSRKSAARMQVNDGKVLLDGVELKPFGVFQPSATRLLDSGFTAYEWSEFVEIDNYRYNRVLAVDDKQEWLDKVKAAFGEQIPELRLCCTTDRNHALETVLDQQPECLLLDVHLTPDEGFEGLWIANQLIARGYKGQILLCSSYGSEKLEAMRQLVKGPCKAPGKNLDAVRRHFLGKDERR